MCSYVLTYFLSFSSFPHCCIISGADPGEVKWVNFHPPFFFLFFSYPTNIEIIFDFSDFSD